MSTLPRFPPTRLPIFHDPREAERLAGEEDDRSDIELMDDDDEKNEAEESEPLTLMGLDQEFGNVVCGSGHAVKMGFGSMTKG